MMDQHSQGLWPEGIKSFCSVRHGGVSTGPYGSLNLGNHVGDDPTAVSAECKLAADEIPVMLIAVGRPAPGNWPRKVRRAVADVVSFSAD